MTAVIPVAPVAGYVKVLSAATAAWNGGAGSGYFPDGDVSAAGVYPTGAFGSRTRIGGTQGQLNNAADFSPDFSMGWLHTLWILTVTAGTPSFKGNVFGRAKKAVATTAGQNSPTFVEWFPTMSSGIAGGQTVSAANYPNSLKDATHLVWAEPVQIMGGARQFLPVCTAIGGTNPTLDVWMAFSRG